MSYMVRPMLFWLGYPQNDVDQHWPDLHYLLIWSMLFCDRAWVIEKELCIFFLHYKYMETVSRNLSLPRVWYFLNNGWCSVIFLFIVMQRLKRFFCKLWYWTMIQFSGCFCLHYTLMAAIMESPTLICIGVNLIGVFWLRCWVRLQNERVLISTAHYLTKWMVNARQSRQYSVNSDRNGSHLGFYFQLWVKSA